MKKIFNAPEVKLITITHDVIATSGDAMFSKYTEAQQLVSSRGYYYYYEDDEEW